MKNYIKYFGVLALGMVACEAEFENPVDEPGFYTSGELDLSNYVALGNSLTAGFADNALYITGQENSFPNILAQQFAKVQETEDFKIPYMNDNAGGLLFGGQPNPSFGTRLVLSISQDEAGNTVQAPVPYTGAAPTTEVMTKLEGPFNNMGVPGAKSFHLLAPGYGDPAGLQADPVTANPYFVRFASSPETSVIQDALAQNPTFFSLWIGNNDVLGYATSGGVNEADITPQALFEGAYGQLVSLLAGTDADGILINIPNVTDVPYFTTVPYAPLDPTNPAFGPMIPTLNATFQQLNPALLALRGIQEGEGGSEYSIEFNDAAASAVIIRDESLTDISVQLAQALMGAGMDAGTATIYGQTYGQVRQATADDLLVLTSSGVIGKVNTERLQQLVAMGVPEATAGQLSVNGVTYPLQDQYVLTPTEQQNVATATEAYNTFIESMASANNWAFLNSTDLLSELAVSGIPYDEGMLTSTFGSGGAFSLDGVHLTPRGYALVANRIIDEINKTYKSSVPKVNIGNYNTITPSNDVQ